MIRIGVKVLTTVDDEAVIVAPEIVAPSGTLHEPVPVSISPLSVPIVLTMIPVTVSVEIGFVIPETVKLKVPDAELLRMFVSVNS